MTYKEKTHQILSSLWKNDDSVGKMCYNQALQDVQTAIDLQEEPVSIWHDASEEPNDKSSCLIHYIVGGEVSYRDIFPVLYNKEAREFVSEPYPHPTGYNVEQSSLEGGVVAEVYKDMRDRFLISDIYKWAYIDDLLNLSNVERTVKNWKEPAREDYEIYGSVAAVKALDRKRVCPQLKGNALHKFKNEFNTIKQIVHLLYNYEDPFCHRVALHWASWGAYNLKSFGNINEKEKAKMDISEESISEDLEEASKEWLRPQLDKSYAAYGETKQMELTHFDGYAMLDAIEFGANWQKAKDKEIIETAIHHAYHNGRLEMKEYMMKEIKSRLVDAATNQDNSTDIGEQTYYNGMVDALGRLRDKFTED